MMVITRNRMFAAAVLCGTLLGNLDVNTVSSLSAKTSGQIKGAEKGNCHESPFSSGINRRDWLVSSSAFASVMSFQTTTQAAESTIDNNDQLPRLHPPTLADEYYKSAFVTNPEAGRSYFPALTPPFNDRATYLYDLGRDAWALEQLLTFANVTATIRCNVVRLKKTGGLWVHSPQWPTGEFCSLLDSIGGPVEHVVLPCNAFEHKAPMKAFVEKYPKANVWIAPGQYGPLGSCGTTLIEKSKMGYRVDGIFGDKSSPPPPWSDEFDIATLYVDLPKNAGPVSEVAFCHRPTKTLITTDAVVYVPKEPSNILSTYFDKDVMKGDPNFWPKSVLQAVFLPLRMGTNNNYPGYEAIVDRLSRAPILRAVVDARAPEAVRDWILEQTTTTATNENGNYQKWDYDRVITSHFASPTQATPADVRACFEYLFTDDLSKSSLPPIACRDWELLDSINQFIAKYKAGEPAVFDFQRGCVAD
mmetsp:Transcript_17590/g.40375  ORF Transcript_17590/g.40375 Transcript_17590/m.40375 type:complete len:474 (-) Transcript_17590:350-1771(-)